MDITDGTPLVKKTTPKDFEEEMDHEIQPSEPSPLLSGRSNSTNFKNWTMGLITCIISKNALTGKISSSYIRLTEKDYLDTTKNYELLCQKCRYPFELAKKHVLTQKRENHPTLFRTEQ